MNELSKKLIEAVKNDLTPSLGVTEPGAIAYAAAEAARAVGGKVSGVTVRLNSGIYKNSFTCAVPGTDGMGCALAAALGAVAGDPKKKLLSTEGASPDEISEAKRLVSEGKARAELAAISPEVFIEAEVETENGVSRAVVSGRHDRLTGLTVNGKDIPVSGAVEALKAPFRVSSVSFDDVIECVETAEGLEFLDSAVKMDLDLLAAGEKQGLVPLTLSRFPSGDHRASERSFAEYMTCGAIEARVRGADAPAMAITGSGSHGILCMLPVFASAEFEGAASGRTIGKPILRRALLLSALVTMYIKECSGLLSTACGCVLASGTGAALGLTYLLAKIPPDVTEDRSALKEMLTDALDSMAASVTGMICHGGNTGCSLKAAVGVDMAFTAARMAVNGFGAESVHGILGASPEETIRNMGRVSRDMLPVEKTILDIMSCKDGGKLL